MDPGHVPLTPVAESLALKLSPKLAVFPGAGYITLMHLTIEIEREDDGRWLAEVPALVGTMTYGQTRDEAIARVKALALRVIADRLERGEDVPEMA